MVVMADSRPPMYWENRNGACLRDPRLSYERGHTQGRRMGGGYCSDGGRHHSARYRTGLASARPSIANAAAKPNDAMNHGCHRLKLVPPSMAQVTKVAYR